MRIGRVRGWIAEKLNRAQAPFRLLIPERGVSALDCAGQPFFDPEADAALFDELEEAVDGDARLARSVRLPYHINDPAFAQALVDSFLSLAGVAQQQSDNSS